MCAYIYTNKYTHIQPYKHTHRQGIQKNLTTFCRPIILTILVEIESEDENFIFQQGGAPPHWKRTAHVYLNENLSERWTGHGGDEDSFLMESSLQSLDLSPCDFFL